MPQRAMLMENATTTTRAFATTARLLGTLTEFLAKSAPLGQQERIATLRAKRERARVSTESVGTPSASVMRRARTGTGTAISAALASLGLSLPIVNSALLASSRQECATCFATLTRSVLDMVHALPAVTVCASSQTSKGSGKGTTAMSASFHTLENSAMRPAKTARRAQSMAHASQARANAMPPACRDTTRPRPTTLLRAFSAMHV